jgi:hypothetical protein
VITDGLNEILLSMVSLWEIAIGHTPSSRFVIAMTSEIVGCDRENTFRGSRKDR